MEALQPRLEYIGGSELLGNNAEGRFLLIASQIEPTDLGAGIIQWLDQCVIVDTITGNNQIHLVVTQERRKRGYRIELPI